MTEDLLKKEICFNCHNWIHFEPEHIMEITGVCKIDGECYMYFQECCVFDDDDEPYIKNIFRSVLFLWGR